MASRRRQVRWTVPARADLRGELSYLRKHRPRLAVTFAREVRETAARLGGLPRLGAVCRDLRPRGRYRHVVIGTFRLIYRVDDDTRVVVIVRFWDGRRNPDELSVDESG